MKYPIIFAPLQGYTEDVYRRLHHKLCSGVEEYVSPFVRLEHGEVRSKDLRDIRPDHNEGLPLTVQLIARDGEEMRRLLDVVLPMGHRRIDLNMGCPFPLQTRHGRGAGLLVAPQKVEEIGQVIAEHAADATFSVKMRIGLDQPDQWREVLPIVNAMPLSRIAVHPRIATQQYKGTVDIEQFDLLLAESRHPVVYNGDLLSASDISQLHSRYGSRLAGVMIGRGLLAQPWLATEYATDAALSDGEKFRLLRELHSALLAHYEQTIPGEQQRLEKVRTFWHYMEPTLGRKAWKRIMKAGNMKNYLAQVAACG